MDIEQLRRGAQTPAQAGAGDLGGVSTDLADAFAVDPHFNWFLRDDAGRARVRRRFFRFLIDRMAFPAGRIDRPNGGGAAAVWMPSEALAPQPLWRELQALPMLLAATGLERFPRLTALRADMDAHHPMDQPHVSLWFLGVAPQAQGLGVGSRLLRAGLDRLDAEGRAAYLETGTERNVALYRRNGFTILSEHRARADAPVMWSMWREPHAG